MTGYNRDFLTREEAADRLTRAYLEAVDTRITRLHRRKRLWGCWRPLRTGLGV